MKRYLRYAMIWNIVLHTVLLGGCGMEQKGLKELELTIREEQFYTNPLGIRHIGDPYILKASDGKYYCYPTSDGGRGYKVWVSEDMINWEVQGLNAYTRTRDSWANGDFWAPEVYEWDGKYYMYYTARWKENDSLRIGLAVSNSPLGPFEDPENQPMFDFGYAAIDANILIDEDGQGYLYYARDCSENYTGGGRESHIYGVKLSADRLRVVGEPVLLARPEQLWELQSGSVRWNEGAWVFQRNGIYYLMYSSNYYADRKYSVGYATSDQPLGTYTKYEKNPILYTQSDWKEISGPGHHSITTSPNGNIWYVAYHTHTVPALGGGDRQVNVDVMGFREDGSIYINGPTVVRQLKPALMEQAYDLMPQVEIFRNGEKVSALKDGEISLYTEGLTKTEVVPLIGKDIIEIRLDEKKKIEGILLYDGSQEEDRVERVTIEFSNGFRISSLEFPPEPGAPAVAQFEPMEISWIKVYSGDPKSSKGALSEIILQ